MVLQGAVAQSAANQTMNTGTNPTPLRHYHVQELLNNDNWECQMNIKKITDKASLISIVDKK